MDSLGDALRTTFRRIAVWFRRGRLDDELRDEVALHLELRRQALVDDGMDPGEAATEAHRMFGNATAIREETREMWGFPSFDTLVQDVRYGARLLRRSPSVTIASIVSLAIGIGFSAGVFSLADVILLQYLPVRAPNELLVFQWRSGPRYPFSSLSGTSWGDDTTQRSTSFSSGSSQSPPAASSWTRFSSPPLGSRKTSSIPTAPNRGRSSIRRESCGFVCR